MRALLFRVSFCSVFYILWIVFYYRLLFANEFGFYVHPGLKPLSWVLFGFMLVFALESTYTVLKEGSFHFPAKEILLFVPLVLMLGFSPKELSSDAISSMTENLIQTSVSKTEGVLAEQRKVNSNVSKEEVSVEQPKISSNEAKEEVSVKQPKINSNETKEEVSVKQPEVSSNEAKEEVSVKEPKADSRKGTIDDKPTIMAVEDNTFVESLLKAYGEKQNEFIGRSFKIKGKFFTSERQFHPNQGAVGRIVVTCCVPHGQFMGFCVQFDKPNEIKGETWIEASGRLEMLDIRIKKVPVIRIKQWKEVKPGSLYLYF